MGRLSMQVAVGQLEAEVQSLASLKSAAEQESLRLAADLENVQPSNKASPLPPGARPPIRLDL